MISGFTTEAAFGCLGATYDRLNGRELFQVVSALISAKAPWGHERRFWRFLVAYEHRKQNRTGHWVDGRRGSARGAPTGRSGRARPNPWARSHAKPAIAQRNSDRQPRLGSLLTRRFFLARRGASPRRHRPPGM